MSTSYLFRQRGAVAENGISKYYLDPCKLDNFLRECHAEILEYAEGCLLDNMLISCDYGMMILKEKAATTWTSTYEALIPEDQDDIWDIWEEFFGNYDEEE